MLQKITKVVFITSFVLLSCKKAPIPPTAQPQPAPEMVVTNLNNREVKYQQMGATLDLNNDNRGDLFFGVQLVGDRLLAVDKRQYIVVSNISTAIPVNINEQIMPMSEGEVIPLDNYNGHNWSNASEIILMERNEFATGTILWRGNWTDHGKKYLPFQIFKNNERFNGWIELTADKVGERIILHRMAISKKGELAVKAGL